MTTPNHGGGGGNQALPMMPLFPLGHVMHCTVDRMNEDLIELQAACCTSSDSDRRKKIILYCEVQRHRALQLLALHHFAENESSIVENAIQGVDAELNKQWTKNAAVWNQEYAQPSMRPYAAWEVVRMFRTVRAPKYDVKTAVNVLVNQDFQGFDLLKKELLQMEAREPDREELQNRVLAKILACEYEATAAGSNRGGEDLALCSYPLDGQVLCQAEAYSVQLSLDADSKWYCTAINIMVAQPTEDTDKVNLSARWGKIIAAQLEDFIAKQDEGSNVFQCTHRFMTTFCGSLAMQILERQASKLGMVAVSTPDSLRCSLSIPDWVLLLKIKANGKSFTCHLQRGNPDHGDSHELQVTISLLSVSLSLVVEIAIAEVARHMLEELRMHILAQSVRHDASQSRVVKSKTFGYQLDLDLFDDETVLSVLYLDAQFSFSTTSKATRWGQFTVKEFLQQRAKEVNANGADALRAGIVLALWNEAEAWDCLSMLSNAVQGVHSAPSYVSPSFELVPHISQFPSLFWSLGAFEGLTYVLVCQFNQSPSLFHIKFLPKTRRLLDSVDCKLCSIGKDEAGEVRVLEMRAMRLETLLAQRTAAAVAGEDVVEESNALGTIFTEMRENWVKKLFQSRFELACQNEVWQGSSLSHIQAFEPFKLEFAEDGLRITCNNAVTLVLKCTDQADAVFDQMLRNMVLLDRLAARCALVGTVQRGNNQLLLVWPPQGAVRFSINEETLHLQAFCVPNPHPLEDKIAQFCERQPSETSLDLALSILSDAIKAVQAAEDFAKRINRSIRVSASSVLNVHFMFDNAQSAKPEDRFTFDCRFYGNQKLLVWNRAGWDHSSPMMGGDVSSLPALLEVLK